MRSSIVRSAVRSVTKTPFSLGKSVRFNTSSADDDIVEEKPLETKVEAPKVQLKGEAEGFEFKAETQKLLDIVIRSVYTDKEIFVRELISNASDALEKRRHLELTEPEEWAPEEGDEPPCVKIDVNSDLREFTITDTGIGMNRDEIIKNIGTICSSGSLAFVKAMKEGGKTSDSIIGQFGVGFYSAFMVANNIKVYTRSAKKGSIGYCWESEGTGQFTITEAEGIGKGTRIVCSVKETEVAFCAQTVIERIVKKYSNFVGYEIFLNGARVNTVEALWMKPKDEVSEQEHTEFYKFIANAYDEPRFRLHYAIDCPLNVNALMYVPRDHSERMNLQRMEPGLSLYCRKVLIQAKCRTLVPEYLRFVKGVVDSEDIPVNLSREMTQDSALMRKLSSVITKKILKWLHDESVKSPDDYTQFFASFGQFLKEGVCTDALNKTDLARLLRFNSSGSEDERQSVSFDDYIGRMPENQSNIYYLSCQNRAAGLASPYYEAFKSKGLEVLFLTHPADHVVMTHIDMFKKHKLVSCESSDPGESEGKNTEEAEEVKKLMSKELTTEQGKALSDFLQRTLSTRAQSVKISTRLTTSPAIITDHEQASMQKFMKSHGIIGNDMTQETKYHLQVNPKHEIVRKLYTLSSKADDESLKLAKIISEQLFDNALIAANLLEDPRSILNRLNSLMSQALVNTSEPISVKEEEKSDVSEKEEKKDDSKKKEKKDDSKKKEKKN